MIKRILLKEKSMKVFVLFVFNLFWCILSLGIFVFNKHFSVDDYSLLYQQKAASFTDIQQNMRIVSGSLYYLLDMWGINIVEWQIFFGTILIITFAWIITRITMEIEEAAKAKVDAGKIILLNGGTLVLFLNAAISEYLYYSGVYAQWIIGILGITYGAICIGREKKIAINWLAGLAALIVTAGSYQTFMAQYAYVVMTLIFLRNEGKINRKSVMASIRAAIAAVVAMGINILGVKALVQCGIIGNDSRMKFDLMKIPELLRSISHEQKSIWIDGMGIYPKGILAFLIVFFVGILFFVMYKRRAKIGEWIYLAIVLSSGFCVMYGAQILQGFIRVTNRGMYAVFGIYAVSVWIIGIYIKECDWKIVKQFIVCVISVFLFYSSSKINGIAVDVLKTNIVSRCYMEEINRRICNYENLNSVHITKVGFFRDAFVSYRYYDFIDTGAYGDMCVNPFLAEWSSVNSLNYYTNRQLELVSVPEDIIQEYEGKNWDEPEWNDQLIFDYDTVYICVF